MATIEQLLAQLDLAKFAPKFKEEDIDIAAARKLSEDDMKELGLTLGARKKLHEALHPAGAVPAAAAGRSAAPQSAKPAAPAPATTAPVITNVCSYRWCFDSQRWPDSIGSGGDHFRLENSDHPTQLIAYSGNHSVCKIFDISLGQSLHKFEPVGPNGGERHYSADFKDDIVVQVGGDDHNCVSVHSISAKKQVASYRGPNEGGLHDVVLTTSASGALLAAATPFYCNVMWNFDVSKGCAPAGKFKIAEDAGWVSCMARDPLHPGVTLNSANNKIYVVDSRARSAVKTIIGIKSLARTLRFPASGNGKFIVADDGPTLIFDYGTGKIVHSIHSSVPHNNSPAAAMFSNVVCCFVAGTYFFYDLNGAPKDIKEPVHDMKGEHSEDLDMTSDYVIGLSGSFVSMERPDA